MTASRRNPQLGAPPADDLVLVRASTLEGGEEDGADPIARVLAELGSAGTGAFVNVYREPTQPGAKEAFLRKWPASEFALEALKASYGGGTYRVRGYRPRAEDEAGPNNMRLFCNETILIEEARDEVKAALPAAAGSNVEVLFTRLAEMQMTGFKQLGELIARQGVTHAAPALTEDAFLDRLAKYKTLFAGESGGGFTPDKMMNLLTSVVGAATGMKELIGGGGDSDREPTDLDVLMKAMDKFGGPLAEMVREFRATPRALPAPGTQSAGAQPTPPAAATTGTGEDVGLIEKAVRAQVAKHLKNLCEKAAKNADPSLWAEVIVEEVPPEKIQELLGAPDWFDKLAAIEPAVKNYPAWFTSLHVEVSALLTEEVTPGTSGDEAQSHAPGADPVS